MQAKRKPLYPFIQQMETILESKTNKLDEKDDLLLIKRLKDLNQLPFAEQNEISKLIQSLEKRIDNNDPSTIGLHYHLLARFYEYAPNWINLKKANQLYERAEELDC